VKKINVTSAVHNCVKVFVNWSQFSAPKVADPYGIRMDNSLVLKNVTKLTPFIRYMDGVNALIA